jgi:hypothetical protein
MLPAPDDDEIRSAERSFEQGLVQLYAAADVILERLRRGIDRAREDADALSAIDAPWAQDAAKQLREAIQKAEISRRDREGKMLLSLPDRTEHAIAEWIRSVRVVDDNSDWVVAAARYGLERLRGLQTAVNEVARVISGTDTTAAQSWAGRISLF